MEPIHLRARVIFGALKPPTSNPHVAGECLHGACINRRIIRKLWKTEPPLRTEVKVDRYDRIDLGRLAIQKVRLVGPAPDRRQRSDGKIRIGSRDERHGSNTSIPPNQHTNHDRA